MDMRANRSRRRWLALAIDIVIVLIYLFFATGGRMTSWPAWYDISFSPGWYERWGGGYYDNLAKAFEHGQTYLLIEPAPEMLALPDPYDHLANAQWRLHDTLLYHGHLYLYWGPVPALFIVPMHWIGVQAVDDSQLTFAFVCGALVFGTLFLLALWERLFSSAPWWTIAPPLLALGLGSALPFLLAPPLVYQAAISGGQCFLLAAFYWVFSGLTAPRAVAWRLFLGGLCIALTCGSRISLAVAALFLTLMVLWRIIRSYRENLIRARLVPVLCFGLPALIGVLGLASYNNVRFGSWKDTGVEYQLYEANHAELDPVISSLHYVLPNIYNYFWRPFSFRKTYPFLKWSYPGDRTTYPSFMSISPSFMQHEGPQIGMLWAFPFMAFALFGMRLMVGWVRRWFKPRAPALPANGKPAAKRYPIGWLMGTVFGVAPLAIAVPLILCGTVSRYKVDAAPTLILAAAIGFGCAYQIATPRPMLQYGVWITGGLLALWSSLMGLLLTAGHWVPEWFKDWNPQLAQLPSDRAAQQAVFLGLIACALGGAIAVVLAPLFSRQTDLSRSQPPPRPAHALLNRSFTSKK